MSRQHSSNSFEDLSPPQRYTPGSVTGNNVQLHHRRTTSAASTSSFSSQNNYDNHEHPSPSHEDILRCLRTSKYETHRKRVREPVEGTCAWVIAHPEYLDWLKKTPGLLWLSADPGCGKSVIASFLVEHLKTRSDTTVCYFFFKDDNEEQKHLRFALCALLHQLFTHKKELSRHAAEAVKDKGKGVTGEVDTLWKTLEKAVADPECGEVICLVDALDECEEETCAQLIRHITSLPRSQMASIPLKFLVTGRPYDRIEKELQSSATVIRLKGEWEVDAIIKDVSCVISEGIKDLESHWKRPGELGYLRDLLENSADRTFLWVSLVLEALKDSADYSREAITDIASTNPRNLAELYDKILSKRQCPQKAKRILNIVVAAIRPLSLSEIYAAFTIDKGHKNIDDLGYPPFTFEATVKNWCGLFVRVIHSEIYLVHKTAREFLIRGSSAGVGDWQYTLHPTEFNLIMADICLNYLALEDIENHPPAIDDIGNDGVTKYALLGYAARHWADHFRDSWDRQMELFESTKRICEHGSKRFLTWLKVYWKTSGQYHPFPNDFTHLMIASWLRQKTVVERLLEEGDINARSKEYGTALQVAALQGDMVATTVLVQGGVQVYICGHEYNISRMRNDEFIGRVKENRKNEEGTLRRFFDFEISAELERELNKRWGEIMKSRKQEDRVIKFLKPFFSDAIPLPLPGQDNEHLLESPCGDRLALKSGSPNGGPP